MFNKAICYVLTLLLSITGAAPVPAAPSIGISDPKLFVRLTPAFNPAHLKGMVINPQNALDFDFLIQTDQRNFSETQKREEYTKLAQYFLASLTIPDTDQWVNLSPFEQNKIIEDNFGKTKMGNDLLASDFLLKRLTASLMYPEEGLGKEFWQRVYAQASQKFGPNEIPVNTFNKVWIVPDKAMVYQQGATAYVVKSHLKVMLEEDYLSSKKHEAGKAHTLASQAIREVIIPAIEKEVNEGEHFANLRQIYSAMVLATWYKKALKESILSQVYANQGKVAGVDSNPRRNEEVYQQYLNTFKKGLYNYVKEEVDPATKSRVARKYFSGGFERGVDVDIVTDKDMSPAMRSEVRDLAMNASAVASLDQAHFGLKIAQTDAALIAPLPALDIQPFDDMRAMEKKLPVIVRDSLVDAAKEVGMKDVAYVAGAVSIMKQDEKMYTAMGAYNQFYHNYIHSLMVTVASLIHTHSAGLLRTQQDIVVTFLAAFKHDYHARKMQYEGEDGKAPPPATPAYAHETIGHPETKEGGQLPDLLGIPGREYRRDAIRNARYEEFVDAEMKKDARRAFTVMLDGLDPVVVYNEVETVISRTDFPSDVQPPDDMYKNMALKIRDMMDETVNKIGKENTVMTDEQITVLIEAVEKEYDKVYAAIERDPKFANALKNKTWVDRQSEIDLRFLDRLKSKVVPERRIRIYSIAGTVELDDQSAAAWLGNESITNEITLGLKGELPFVSIQGNWLFYKTQLLQLRTLRRLKNLPLQFKIQLFKKFEYYAKLASDFAKEKGNAQAAGVPDFIFPQLQSAWAEWQSQVRDQVLMEFGLYLDKNGELRKQDGDVEKMLRTLKTSVLGESFSLSDIYLMITSDTFSRVKYGPNQEIIAQGQEVNFREAGMYIVLSGEVEVLKDGEKVATLKAGANFGETAFLTRLPRNATVVTGEGEVILARLQGDFMQGLRFRNPDFNRGLIMRIAPLLRPEINDQSLPAWAQSDIVMKMDVVGNEEKYTVQESMFEAGLQPTGYLTPSEYKARLDEIIERFAIRNPDAIKNIKMVALSTPFVPGQALPLATVYVDPLDNKKIMVLSNEMFMDGLTVDDQVKALRRAYYPDLAMSAVDQKAKAEADAASIAEYGGIDFNPANLELSIEAKGKSVVPLPPADMAQLGQIPGFVPQLLEIKPVTALPIAQN